jgi:hypothetical protein
MRDVRRISSPVYGADFFPRAIKVRGRRRRNARIPTRKAKDSGFKVPPPPDLVGAGFSVTFADALSDSPLGVELQVMPNVNTDAASRATASVTIWLPFVAFVPAQLSSAPPPVAVQPVALNDFHVSVVDCPAVIVVADAEIVAVTRGQFQTTEAEALTAATPGAVQLI